MDNNLLSLDFVRMPTFFKGVSMRTLVIAVALGFTTPIVAMCKPPPAPSSSSVLQDMQTNVPDRTSTSRMSPAEAQRLLKGVHGFMCLSVWCGVEFTKVVSIEWTDENVLVFVGQDGGRSNTLPVQSLKPEITIDGDRGKVAFIGKRAFEMWPGSSIGTYAPGSAELARKIGEALTVVQASPSPRQSMETSAALFAVQAKSYRDATVKPVPGEDVRRYQVQAEAAINEKRLEDAARLYDRGLEIAPWWPEGQFNAALILGELHQYSDAIEHMKRYLALVPDAPNARAAQDKIYVWEDAK